MVAKDIGRYQIRSLKVHGETFWKLSVGGPISPPTGPKTPPCGTKNPTLKGSAQGGTCFELLRWTLRYPKEPMMRGSLTSGASLAPLMTVDSQTSVAL
jgi:hypothetical protein